MYQGRLGEAMREGLLLVAGRGRRQDLLHERSRPDVRRPGGPEFKLLRVNELRAQVLASPALVDGTWYWRTDRSLLAIGNPAR